MFRLLHFLAIAILYIYLFFFLFILKTRINICIETLFSRAIETMPFSPYDMGNEEEFGY